jgi:hypothetical protein
MQSLRTVRNGTAVSTNMIAVNMVKKFSTRPPDWRGAGVVCAYVLNKSW